MTTIYAKYRYLYGAAPYEIPLVLTTKVGAGTDLLSYEARRRCREDKTPQVGLGTGARAQARRQQRVQSARSGFDGARIHAASIYCSDGRFGEQMDEFLHQGLRLPRYDRLADPGGPACLSGALSVFWEGHSAERQLDFLCHVHKLERLIMIAHEGCAFYLEWLKVKPEEFAARQLEDVKAREPHPPDPANPGS